MFGNGNRKGPGPVVLPGGRQVPIVGQPATLREFCPTVLIQCNCEAKTPLLIVGAKAIKVCTACRRGFTIAAIQWDAKTGQLGIEIGCVAVPEQPGTPPAPAASTAS